MTRSPLPGAGVAVLILTRNQRETTLRTLASFTDADRRDADFLVWDNGSTDGTEEAVRRRFPEVHVHRHSANLGVAGGRNAAAALALQLFDPDYFAFVDNDLVVTPGYLEALLVPMLRDDHVGRTQPKLRLLDEPELINDGARRPLPGTGWIRRSLRPRGTRGSGLLPPPAGAGLRVALHPHGHGLPRSGPHIRGRAIHRGLCPGQGTQLDPVPAPPRLSTGEGGILPPRHPPHRVAPRFPRTPPGALVGSVAGLREAFRRSDTEEPVNAEPPRGESA